MKKTMAIACCCMLSTVAFATQQKHPPVTEKTVYGVWEAISGTRVYRMELTQEGRSFLAFAASGGRLKWVYELQEMKVRRGKVFLSFKQIGGEGYVIHISGTGVAGQDGGARDPRQEGLLDVDLVMEPDRRDGGVTRELQFKKDSRKTITERIYEAANWAKLAIEEARAAAKQKTHNQPLEPTP